MPPTNSQTTHLRYYIPIVCIMALLGTSCSGPTPRERQQALLLAKLDTSIQKELVFIGNETNLLYNILEERLQDPATAEKTKQWYPAIEKIKECSKVLTNYIEHTSKLLDSRKVDDVLIKDVWGDSLYKALVSFKRTTLNTNERILAEFGNAILPGIDTSVNLLHNKASNFTQQNFTYLNNEEARAVLHYWQKEVLATEYKLITFCFYNTTINFCGLQIAQLLVAQSHDALLPGQTLTITAGVGSFSRNPNTKIYIAGKAVTITEDAIAIYQVKAPKKKGNHIIPVTIEFINANGENQTEQKNIAYKVQ